MDTEKQDRPDAFICNCDWCRKYRARVEGKAVDADGPAAQEEDPFLMGKDTLEDEAREAGPHDYITLAEARVLIDGRISEAMATYLIGSSGDYEDIEAESRRVEALRAATEVSDAGAPVINVVARAKKLEEYLKGDGKEPSPGDDKLVVSRAHIDVAKSLAEHVRVLTDDNILARTATSVQLIREQTVTMLGQFDEIWGNWSTS